MNKGKGLVCLIINIFVLTGLGTILVGELKQGIMQLIIACTSIIVFSVGILITIKGISIGSYITGISLLILQINFLVGIVKGVMILKSSD